MTVEEVQKELDTVRAERDDYERSFNLRFNADMRAIKLWREATGQELVWPDHADLCVWLLEQLKDKNTTPDLIEWNKHVDKQIEHRKVCGPHCHCEHGL